MTFFIPVTYSMCGDYEVEANTIEEAKKLVEAGNHPYDTMPTNAYYVDDSMLINAKALLPFVKSRNHVKIRKNELKRENYERN